MPTPVSDRYSGTIRVFAEYRSDTGVGSATKDPE
jgi:hypothetical protein